MKRTLCALLAILAAACSGTTEPPAGFGSLTGEWYAQYSAADLFAEWSLSLTELSTGYVAGTFTLTNYAGLRPTPEPVMRVDTGSVAGEHRGIDVVLLLMFENGRQSRYEGRQVESNVFWVERETAGKLEFVRVDPS
ncbi:MAG: hypothetical protein OXH46_00915 [Gemmatimonadetes bacterium]|nr:hypothetical protein [Gemmatimonadota bacterium]